MSTNKLQLRFEKMEEREVLLLQERLGAISLKWYLLVAYVMWMVANGSVLLFAITAQAKMRGVGVLALISLIIGGLSYFAVWKETRLLKKDLLYREKYSSKHQITQKIQLGRSRQYYLQLRAIPQPESVPGNVFNRAEVGDIVSYWKSRYAGLTLPGPKYNFQLQKA